jgi:methyl-accepting chemotaxis protein
MYLIADTLLIAGALGAAFYCIVLSRRLNQLGKLENGVGGAISELSSQVTKLNQALSRAKSEAQESSAALESSAERAEAAARQLELLLASLHEFPQEPKERPVMQHSNPQPKFRRRLAGRAMMESQK